MPFSTYSKISVAETGTDGVLRVIAEGSLTSQTIASANSNAFRDLLGPQWTTCRIMLDLGQTTFIDSSAIGWLIESHKAVRTGGGIMVIHSMTRRIRQVFDLLNLNQMLNFQPDETSAREFIAGRTGTIRAAQAA